MDLIQEVLAFSRDYVNGNQTSERRNKIAAAYRKATGEIMKKGCSTCYIEALFKIKKAMEKKPSSYRLKPGAVLTAFGDESKILTNKNITDELAEFHLRHNPGVIKYFEIYPDPLPWLGKPEKELEIVPASVPVPDRVLTNNDKKEARESILGKPEPVKTEVKTATAKDPVKNKGGRYKR